MKLIIFSFALLSVLSSVAPYKVIGLLSNITLECTVRLPTRYNDRRHDIYKPVAYTLESFISLVEKVEHMHPNSDIFDITNMLLERFYFSEMLLQKEGQELKISSDSNKVHRSDFLVAMMKKASSDFKSDVRAVMDFFEPLSPDERCSLYMMIGHNINVTYREEMDKRLMVENSHSDQTNDLNVAREVHAMYPREQGLVSLHSDTVNAVAMGRILVGIAAGKFKDTKVKLSDLDSSIEDGDKEVEIVTALTIGDAIAFAEMTPDVGTKYGPPGEWNTTSCPTEYKLKSKNVTTTDAELRGSIDGYLLGQHISEIQRDNNKLKLSQLIRMFYSKHGIRVTNGKVGFCERSNIIGGLDSTAQVQTVDNVIVYYRYKTRKQQTVLPNWQAAYNEYTNRLSAEMPRDNICETKYNPIDTKEKDPEQPIDVFVVLDLTEHSTRGLHEQIDVIGHLSGYMDIGANAGQMTILSNYWSEQTQQRELSNATNSGCVTCALERLDIFGGTRNGVYRTLETLNDTLQRYEETRALEESVPAKVVIFFHYDTNTRVEDEAKLNDARWQLINRHRDVRIFAIGTGEILEKIATDSLSMYTSVADPKSRALELKKQIARVPATLQYYSCGDRKYNSRSEGDHVFNGYITPDEKQLWAMYPEYFLKSFKIEIKFKAEMGKIRVCYERGVNDPSLNDHDKDRCREVENSGTEIVFTIHNPCHGRDVFNCPPINFAVIGGPADANFRPLCTDPKCRRSDQIKFTMTHKGISCNGVLGLLASPILLLTLAYAALRNLL